jgi:RNA polymerase sigma-70 factor (ECF subfamily)
VARVLAASVPSLERSGVVVEPRSVNGQQGSSSHGRDGRLTITWTLDILDGQIYMVPTVLNPDKLGHLGPVADPWTVAREAEQARLGRGGASAGRR